nr:(2Fe-2S)-binding protein [Algoriphagus sp.]
MATFNLKVNGKNHQVDVEDDTPLLWVLRDHLGLVGTKFSCGVAQCGACTVHINGNSTFSCVTPISSVGNSEVITIEGLSEDGDHPVQKAWEEVDVAQCGYCQAGQIMQAEAFLKSNP